MKQKRVGICGAAQLEIVHRAFLGVLKYADDVGGFEVHDFRMPPERDATRLPPSWIGSVDGMVVFAARSAGQSNAKMGDWVLSGGVPTVSLGAEWKDPRIPCFFVCSRSLADLAAQHLVECNCQSFLYLGFQESVGSAERGASFCDALTARGLLGQAYETPHRLTGTFEDELLIRRENHLIHLLTSLEKPLGVWALNDNFAGAVCRLCHELGLAIPEQVRVLGTDDLAIARMHRPHLSSIRTPGERIGYLAMRTLHGMLLGQNPHRWQEAVPATKIAQRGSTRECAEMNSDILDALEYIAEHACAGLTVKQLVDHLNISRRSFEDKFRRAVGRSPGEELSRVRLERALDLLRQTQLSIGRIAAMIGFAETAAFSKFIRLQTGLSPRDIRQQGDRSPSPIKKPAAGE